MRQYLNPYQFHVPVSIHASVKDATSLGVFNLSYTGVSIHASVKDATDLFKIFQPKFRVSIHASVKDATFWRAAN